VDSVISIRLKPSEVVFPMFTHATIKEGRKQALSQEISARLRQRDCGF
jgi:hypothetical protein